MRVIDGETYISPSDVIQYLYCPRFIYYMYCLDLPQNEKSRDKVLTGRYIHEKKAVQNKNYLRKKIGAVDKKIEEDLVSQRHHIHGVVDEILTLEDGTMAPLDYKFAEGSDGVYRTYRYQSVLYALMIEEVYDIQVDRGYLCYVRSKNKLKSISITEESKEKAIDYASETRKIILRGIFPEATDYSRQCIDCTYNSICLGAKIEV